MAKVTITVSDGEDGKVDISTEFDPPAPGPAAKDKTLPPAQAFGAALLQGFLEAAQEA